MVTFFGLTFLLLGILTAIGWPIMAFIGVRLHAWQRLALAPMAATAAIMMVARWLSSAGMPMQYAAWIVAGGLCAWGVGTALLRRCPRIPRWQETATLAFAAAVAVAMAAVPAFWFGMDWMGKANPDMAHYCLSATRLLSSGLSSPPDLALLASGYDNAQWLWWLHGVFGHRSGTDLLLAAVCGVSGFSPDVIYMPLILALQGAFAMAILATFMGRMSVGLALLAALAVGCSYGQAMGVSNQLIGQIVGLGQVMFAVACLGSDWFPRYLSGAHWLRRGSGLALPITGLFLAYPEIMPILCAVIVAWFVGVAFTDMRSLTKSAFRPVAACMAGFLLAANLAIPSTIHFISSQSGTLNRNLADGVQMFPWFLDLLGFPIIFGLMPIDRSLPAGPAGEAVVIVGMLLFLVVLVSWYRWWRETKAPGAVLGFGLAAILVLLNVRGDGFGAYKAAWFIQPMLWLGMVCVVRFLFVSRIARLATMAAVIVLVCVNGAWNISTGLRQVRNDLSYAPGFSSTGMNRQAQELMQALPSGSLVAIESMKLSVAKLQAVQATRVRSGHLSINALHERGIERHQKSGGSAAEGAMIEQFRRDAARNPAVASFFQAAVDRFSWEEVSFPGKDPWNTSIFFDGVLTEQALSKAYLLVEPSNYTVFNRTTNDDSVRSRLSMRPIASLPPRIVPVEAKGAALTYQSDGIGLYPLEPDPVCQGFPFESMGRRIACRVIGNDAPARSIISFTTGSLRGKNSELPKLRLLGADTEYLPVVGSGSCRVIGIPVEPLLHQTSRYVALDAGRPAIRLENDGSGSVMAHLLRPSVSVDNRSITGWLREWSLVPLDHIIGLATGDHQLRELIRFQTMFYSGIWEDGWTGEEAYVVLGKHAKFSLSGLILPEAADADGLVGLEVELDGNKVSHRLTPGRFTLEFGPSAALDSRLWLRTARTTQLPAPDGRQVGMSIERIKVADYSGIATGDHDLRELIRSQRTQALSYSGIWDDGWTGEEAYVVIGKHAKTTLSGRVLSETAEADGLVRLEVELDGNKVVHHLAPGHFTIELGSSVSPESRLWIRPARTTRLLAPDDRMAGVLIERIKVSEPSGVP